MKKNALDLYNNVVSFLDKHSYEIYIYTSTLISSLLAINENLLSALACFIIITTIDTVTRINADAVAKKLVFNPFRSYFWREIKSDRLREMLNKVVMEYGVYLIVSLVIDELVLSRAILFDFFGKHISLPVAALYVFSFIELWSIGENIDEAGGINLFKRVLHFLPEKFQKIVLPKQEEE